MHCTGSMSYKVSYIELALLLLVGLKPFKLCVYIALLLFANTAKPPLANIAHIPKAIHFV